MESDRASADHGDVLHATLHAHALAGGGHPQPLRQHRDLTGSIADFVEPEGHERQTPRRGDDTADADGLILIAAGMTLQIRDVRIAQRKRAPAQRHGETDDSEEAVHNESPIPNPQSPIPSRVDRAESWNDAGCGYA